MVGGDVGMLLTIGMARQIQAKSVGDLGVQPGSAVNFHALEL